MHLDKILWLLLVTASALASVIAVSASAPDPGPQKIGDVNCNGEVDSVDALMILRDVADLGVTLPPGCPWIGSTPTPANCSHDFQPVARSITDLAQRLDRACDDIGVIEAREVEWPNSCLGATLPGDLCLDVITDGYWVLLTDFQTDQEYVYHTDCATEIVATDFLPPEAEVDQPPDPSPGACG